MTSVRSDTSVQHPHRLRPTGLGARTWAAVVVVGLAGQIAWTVENMYLNLFVYDTITDDPTTIAVMVAASAIAATLAAVVVGALSDRVGRRRVFIVAGYLLWGVSTMAFGLVTVEGLGRAVSAASAVTVAATAVVLLDCVMSFLGGTANDGAFNAWVTDVTSEHNRGRVESVIAVMPLISMLIVFGGLDGLTRAGSWQPFFVVVGAVMIVAGVLALLLVRDVANEPRQHDPFWRSVSYGLRPATARANPDLYITLGGYSLLGISTQVFLPYLLIYLQKYLRIEAYALVLAVVLVGASVASVLAGRVIDRIGKILFLPFAVSVYAVGLLLIVFARDVLPVIGAGLVMMSGFMMVMATVGAATRDFTPPDRVGMVQGLRMIFVVLVPMVIGPFIGAAVIRGADEYYEELGQLKQVPTPSIFLAALAVVALMVVPVAVLLRRRARGEIRKPEPPSPLPQDAA